MAEVRLVDLEVIKRYSLAVRRDLVPAEELAAALEASLRTVREAMRPPEQLSAPPPPRPRAAKPRPRPAKNAAKATPARSRATPPAAAEKHAAPRGGEHAAPAGAAAVRSPGKGRGGPRGTGRA